MSTTFRWIQIIVLSILIITVFTVGLSFYFNNDQMIAIDYFIGSREYYFSFWLLSFFTFGVLMGWITVTPLLLKLKRQNTRLSRQVKVSEKEINNLRVLPVKDTH